jgi:hypothetical protein
MRTTLAMLSDHGKKVAKILLSSSWVEQGLLSIGNGVYSQPIRYQIHVTGAWLTAPMSLISRMYDRMMEFDMKKLGKQNSISTQTCIELMEKVNQWLRKCSYLFKNGALDFRPTAKTSSPFQLR